MTLITNTTLRGTLRSALGLCAEILLVFFAYPDFAYVTPEQFKELERFEFQFEPDDELKKKWEYFSALPCHEKPCRKFYRLNQDSIEVLKSISDSLFKFTCAFDYDRPNDPIFFREDDSVFFSSDVHEGVCYLFPRDDEDIGELVKHRAWHEVPINRIGFYGHVTNDVIPWSDM